MDAASLINDRADGSEHDDMSEGMPELRLSDDDDDEEPKPSGGVDDDKMSSAELDWLSANTVNVPKVPECTVCNDRLSLFNGVRSHPSLYVSVCSDCLHHHNHGGDWTLDEHGKSNYCEFCAEGGSVVVCDHCPKAFCKKCLKKNLGKRFLSHVVSSSEWKCLVCDPAPIFKLRAQHRALRKSDFVLQHIDTAILEYREFGEELRSLQMEQCQKPYAVTETCQKLRLLYKQTKEKMSALDSELVNK